MKLVYQNMDCTCCKSKEVCKFYNDMSNFKVTTNNNDEMPVEIKINCQHFTTDVNYR